MNKTSPLKFIDYTLWIEFQENLSQYLNMSIGLYDNRGESIVPASGEGKLCEILKQSEKGRKGYRDAYKKVINRAMQRGEPYHYTCFTGQCIFALPVSLNDDFFLHIVGGHLYLQENPPSELTDLSDELKLEGPILLEIEGDSRSTSLKEFFGKLNLVKKLSIPFLKSLCQKGYYEKEYSQIKTLVQISSPAGFHKSKDELYNNVFNTLGVLFDIAGASIMETNEKGGYKNAATFGDCGEMILPKETIESSEDLRTVIDSHKPHYFDRPSELRKFGLKSEVTSAIIFPMSNGCEVLGLLCIFNTEIDEDSINLISILVSQLSIVIKSISREQATASKLRKIDSITDVYQKIAPVLNQEELFDIIMDKSIEIAGAEQGSLMMLEEGNGILYVKATKGIDKSILENVKVRMGEGISGKVAKNGKAMLINDIEHEALKRKNRSRYKTKSFVSLPLKLDTRTIGVINISDKISGEVFSEEDLQLLHSFACYASIALERGEYFRLTKELKEISVTDSLTGLMNKGCFHERLIENIERSKRYNEPCTLFMIDVDDFKQFNDKYGHLAGDDALKQVAYAVKEGVRTIDIVARVGGEEICVILPNTKKNDSFVIADRMRKEVRMMSFLAERVPETVHLSVSIGIAEYPADGETPDDVLHRADMAMYTAKDEGKNKVVTYSLN